MLLQRAAAGQQTEFSYQLPPDPALVFRLDNKLLNQYRGMKRYTPHMAEQAVRHALMRKAASLQQQGVRIQFSPPNLPLQFTVQADDSTKAKTVAATLRSLQKSALDQYLARGYYFLLDAPVKGCAGAAATSG